MNRNNSRSFNSTGKKEVNKVKKFPRQIVFNKTALKLINSSHSSEEDLEEIPKVMNQRELSFDDRRQQFLVNISTNKAK